VSVRRAALAALLGLVLAAVAAPARADAATPIIGIGEQSHEMFASPYWHALGVKHVRVIAAWDALNHKWQREDLDRYMFAAHANGARVLLGFGHARSPVDRIRRHVPSVARFKREFLKFRKRYPFVRDYLTWNEANHCGEPTCHKAPRVARFYNTIRANCRGCKVVAGDVLDTPTMVPWVREFRRYARKGKLIWGLHNYIDANRFRTSGTRALLRAAPRGEIWFTETGGLVVRRNGSNIAFPGNKKHAAAATRQVFKLAALSRRVTRIYFYHWQPAKTPLPTWDSALVDPKGKPRPAYRVLQAWIIRAEREKQAPRPFAPSFRIVPGSVQGVYARALR
jgi:hypothetical protein